MLRFRSKCSPFTNFSNYTKKLVFLVASLFLLPIYITIRYVKYICIILRIYFIAWKASLIFSETALVHIFAILLIGLGLEGPIIKK